MSSSPAIAISILLVHTNVRLDHNHRYAQSLRGNRTTRGFTSTSPRTRPDRGYTQSARAPRVLRRMSPPAPPHRRRHRGARTGSRAAGRRGARPRTRARPRPRGTRRGTPPKVRESLRDPLRWAGRWPRCRGRWAGTACGTSGTSCSARGRRSARRPCVRLHKGIRTPW